jgi:oligoribonuclease NrnB/cAMP/cGMP phosphodiesterase (DHH superfamily)
VYSNIESIESAVVIFFEGCECIYKRSKKKEKTKEGIIKEFSHYKNQLECWETIARNSMRKINSNKEVDKEYKKESKRVYLGTKEYISKVNKEIDDFEKRFES